MILRRCIHANLVCALFLPCAASTPSPNFPPFTFEKKDPSGKVQTAYKAHYQLHTDFFTQEQNLAQDLPYNQAPVVIQRQYNILAGEPTTYQDKIILYPIPRHAALQQQLANLLAPMVAASQSYISQYDSHFMSSYTDTTPNKVISKWTNWSRYKGRQSKLLVLHQHNESITPIGEVGFNLTYDTGQKNPEIFSWRVNNEVLSSKIGDRYKGIMQLAAIGAAHFIFTSNPSLEGLTAVIDKKNQASNRLTQSLGFQTNRTSSKSHYTLTKQAFYQALPMDVRIVSTKPAPSTSSLPHILESNPLAVLIVTLLLGYLITKALLEQPSQAKSSTHNRTQPPQPSDNTTDQDTTPPQYQALHTPQPTTV